VEEKNEGPTTTKGERRKWIGGREGEGMEEEGICRTNVKLLPTPLKFLDTVLTTQSSDAV